MSLQLNSEITYLKGVGPKRSALYKRLDVSTIFDLVTYYPRNYTNFTKFKPISELEIGEIGIFKGIVTDRLNPWYSSGLTVYKAVISDGSDEIVAVIFNSEYSYNKLKVDKEFIFSGKIGGNILQKEITSPEFISIDEKIQIRPKYPLTAGLSHEMIITNLKTAFAEIILEDLLPENIIKENNFLSFSQAVYKIHFPESESDVMEARKRLIFEEFLSLQLGMQMFKIRNKRLSGAVLKNLEVEEFLQSLPFKATNAQKRTINECLSDMKQKHPMNRLLQGDVGSGKTAVAAAICWVMARNGFQSVVMAPTEVLAKQHFHTFSNFLSSFGLNVALLSGSMTVSQKNVVKSRLKSGEIDIVVGTHALIQKSVIFHNLGLVITDEQHRFGVNQRSSLLAKGKNPHSLVMSATPIPRTLALMIYGDLDISVIDEMPLGRIPIKTYCVNSSFHERLYKFILKHVKLGFQAYIVCPLIDDGDDDRGVNEKKAATAYYEKLKNTWFQNIEVGLLHGKMKHADKDLVMNNFKENRVQVLVSTTVIEVGVDVPNAVIMLIENAEQFGLSQLHQLRGRVGRGSEQSYCVLVTDSETEFTKRRMDVMVQTTDGFKIANEDLNLRGPGDFFGRKQHGLPQLKIADLAEDIEILQLAQEISQKEIKNDPNLDLPQNKGLKLLARRIIEKGEEFGYN